LKIVNTLDTVCYNRVLLNKTTENKKRTVTLIDFFQTEIHSTKLFSGNLLNKKHQCKSRSGKRALATTVTSTAMATLAVATMPSK